MKHIITLLFVGLSTVIFSQDEEKKVINNDTYDDWKSLKNEGWSPSGKYIKYEITPAKGDGYLYFKSTDGAYRDSVFKGTKATLHYKDAYAAFIIKPGYDTVRILKLDKVKPDKMPKDTLGIIWFGKDSLMTVPKVKSFKMALEGDWMAYLSTEDERADCPTYKKWQIFKRRKKCTKIKTSGHTLTAMNPITGQVEIIDRVKTYQFSKNGKYLAYTISEKGKSDTLSLRIFDITEGKHINLMNDQLAIKSLQFDDDHDQFAFLTSTDTNEIKTFQLGYWKPGQSSAMVAVDTGATGLKTGWSVSEHGRLSFSHNGEVIYFGSNEMVQQEPEDTLLKSEKAVVDVWSWTDKKVQPQQLRNLKRDQTQSFLTAYQLNTKKVVHLQQTAYESIDINSKTDAKYALISDDERYQKTYSWAFPWPSDFGLIELETGNKEILFKKLGYYPKLSPSAEHIVWYNGQDSTWNGFDPATKKSVNLTSAVNDRFYSDNNGSPYNPFPERALGWVKDGDRERLLISSEYDIWLIDPGNNMEPECITKGHGKKEKIKYSLYHFDRDSAYIDLGRTLIQGVDNESKAEFVTTLAEIGKKEHLKGDHTFYYVVKAKESDQVLFRKMNVANYPELYTTTLKFDNIKQLSETNPEQEDYNWATVEQVKWNSYKGLELDGLLYKPENFDSTKSYPMIVYFYEKYDDRLHSYYSPKPTASIVYPTEYASNGYIVFIPNILYTPGHPAKSAYDCILSGTDYLTQKYSWIDTTKLGLQGQSWGGYQTAQLVTMTDKYACGMAGAPVSNMFSAYGGIRWRSGMSRMFQYERTQSRIGCTIWDCPELYIENSPIFGLPNVNTPLLIMHNDNDGAVPWYQGIEMFMGLRRLEKPVWLLNYNGDNHNLRQIANKEDLSLRMRQFFDYYLKDEPAPVWMKDGVPAVEKGKPDNLKLEGEE